MPQARELFEAAKLQEAIEQATNDVRANPNEVSHRTFLFELLCFAGQWERAEKQLDVIGHQSAKAELGVMIYRAIIKAEKERQRLFSEGINPHFLKEPPAYVDLNLDAINKARSGKLDEAQEILERAEEQRPAIPGKIDGEAFSDFRDADDFIAPALEVFVKDKYVWMPLEQVKSVEVQAPNKLRDLLWASARIESLDGTIGEVYIPAIYEGTGEHGDDQAKLGRLTDWRNLGSNLFRTVGLKMFQVDESDKTLFEIHRIEFEHATSADVVSAPK